MSTGGRLRATHAHEHTAFEYALTRSHEAYEYARHAHTGNVSHSSDEQVGYEGVTASCLVPRKWSVPG